MRTRKLLQLVLDKLCLEREELEHIVQCPDCELRDGGEDYGYYYCSEFWRLFREEYTYTPIGDGPSLMGQTITDVWSKEILRQALPVLRFEQFKEGGENANQEA